MAELAHRFSVICLCIVAWGAILPNEPLGRVGLNTTVTKVHTSVLDTMREIVR